MKNEFKCVDLPCMHNSTIGTNFIELSKIFSHQPPVVRGGGNKTFNLLFFSQEKENIISDFFINEAKENRKTLQKIKARIKIPKEKESNVLVREIDDKFSLFYSAEKIITERQIEEFIKNLPNEE